MNQQQLIARRSDYRTNHILHLILSIITGGIWLIVWALVALSNASERRKIDKQLEKL